MHGGGSGGAKKARIEIIPLIDVIFFLLATFVLFTLSLNKSNGIKVHLPVSETAVPRDPSGTVTVSITEEGALAWNMDLVTLDEFLLRLQQYHLQEPDGRILINGDERAFFAQAVYVFDEARKAGFLKVFVETRSR
ncbi:MAG: biopolymer transporter ExbD [Lacunisphaera sp.]|nr:biopolymer transporter ExbD [Lacunisphaera sp.]